MPTQTQDLTLTACPECDLLVRDQSDGAKPPYSSLCPRCGALLYRRDRHGLEHTLALAWAALVVLIIANAFPVVGMKIQGQRIDTTIIGAALQLWRDDMPEVSLLVLATTTVMPLLEILGVIWLMQPLLLGRRPPGFAPVFRAMQAAHPWAMVEVFILGILVALVKPSHLADVLPGPAMLGFGVLMLLLTTMTSLMEPRDIWQAWEEARP